MTYFYQSKNVKTYNTNSGLCIVLENKKKDLLFVSSDMNKIDQFIFRGDGELYNGKQFLHIDSNQYEMIGMQVYSNMDSVIEFEEMLGDKYRYNIKIVITVKKIS